MSNTGKTITAAILVIGNEILSGRTQDSNTQYIAEKLNGIGVRVGEVRVVPDIADKIVTALGTLRHNYTYVFTTGGIGPTHDDITTECIARAFGVDCPINAEAQQILEAYYGAAELTDARLRMARIPVGATLIPNPVSAAPGFRIENVHVMAGVPRIMQAMMDSILGQLEHGTPMLSNTIACDLGESMIAAEMGALEAEYAGVEIGSYPHYRVGSLSLSVVLRGTDAVPLVAATRRLAQIIAAKGGTVKLMALQADIA
ncbi:MAG: molybdopterin-binding protein [Pseudomonadota bacterium]